MIMQSGNELALLKNNNDPTKDFSSYTDYFGEYQDMDLTRTWKATTGGI